MENLNNVSQLLNEVKTISDSYDRVAEATGENFNIFSILQVETDEVRTHSRFLVELLNAKGVHGQREIFLEKFLEYFKIENFNAQDAMAYVEHYVGRVEGENGGRIDILIQDTSGKVIMIENKINAGEQKDQLLRYYNAYPHERIERLFFLTLDGAESNNREKFSKYETISYEIGIIGWLEICKKEAVNVPILRETISQYINLLKKLTNRNLNMKMNKDIIDRVLKDKDSFLSYKSVIGIQNDIFKEIIDQDFFKVLKEIAEANNLILEIDKEVLTGKKYNGFRFSNELLSKKNLTIRFNYEDGGFKNPLLGFEYFIKPNTSEFNHEQIVDKFKSVFGAGLTFSTNFCCFLWYKEMSNLNNLNVLYNLRYGSLKQDIKDKISKMLDIVKSVS